LELDKKLFTKKAIDVLKKLQHLRLFHFAVLNKTVSSLELKYVSLCLKFLPHLRSVGRYFQLLYWRQLRDMSSVKNVYHDIKGLECPTTEKSTIRRQLALQEMFIVGGWDESANRWVPKLVYLHIKNGVTSDYLHIPNTVTVLGLYANQRIDGRPLSFPPQLCVLILKECNLHEVSSGGILKQCPNLEELHLHHCKLKMADMVPEPIDMRRSRLQSLTLEFPCDLFPDGLLTLLLQAPLLTDVEIILLDFQIKNEEQMELFEQIRCGRILQKLSWGRFYGRSLQEILLAVKAFCPDAVDVNDYTAW
jgi:hypothetical protein